MNTTFAVTFSVALMLILVYVLFKIQKKHYSFTARVLTDIYNSKQLARYIIKNR